MKATHIFCASQAAITTMDSNILHLPSSSSSAVSTAAAKGGRAIDRHNPIIQDQKRLTTTTVNLTPPLPSTNNKTVDKKKSSKTPKSKGFGDENNGEQLQQLEQLVTTVKKNQAAGVRRQGGVLLGWGCTRPGDFISPANSSRFLLTDKLALSDQFDPLLKQVSPPPPPPPPEERKSYGYDDRKSFNKDERNIYFSSSPVKTPPRCSSSVSSRSSADQQVVVLKVSLHCRGCERKMRKHISKMEGVTSFDIDFLAKKVTVVGDITPLAVLTSISKVKNAKLLTPTTISSSSEPQSELNFSEIKKQLGIVA